MKINVNDTTNKQLDWLVAKALGCKLVLAHDAFRQIAEHFWTEEKLTEELAKMDNDWKIVGHNGNTGPIPAYSTSWAEGGIIIEREGINIEKQYCHINNDLLGGTHWIANFSAAEPYIKAEVPLVAAMRCFVAIKLGEEVEIPEGLH